MNENRPEARTDIDKIYSAVMADTEALEEAKMTLEVIKKTDPGVYDEMIDDTLSLIRKALSASILGVIDKLVDPQEPVAVWELQEGGWDTIADSEWMESLPIGTKLYTTPPQREHDKESDAVDTLTEEGWTWDGDQWQRPAQEQPEPVAWISRSVTNGPCLHWSYGQAHKFSDDISPLYSAPPQREWQGLTVDELNMIGDRMRTWNSHSLTDVYCAIEKTLREKNNG